MDKKKKEEPYLDPNFDIKDIQKPLWDTGDDGDENMLSMEMAVLSSKDTEYVPDEILCRFIKYGIEYDNCYASNAIDVQKGVAESIAVKFICPYEDDYQIEFSFGFVKEFQSRKYGNNKQVGEKPKYVFGVFHFEITPKDIYKEDNLGNNYAWMKVTDNDFNFDNIVDELGFIGRKETMNLINKGLTKLLKT
jgi:hypothetical protein